MPEWSAGGGKVRNFDLQPEENKRSPMGLQIDQAIADYRAGRLQDPNDDVWAAWDD